MKLVCPLRLAQTALASAAAILLCSATATTQEAASTLHRLSETAPVVAQVRVLHRQHRDGRIQVTVRTSHLLKGELPRTFKLSEPAGRACGMALHGVLVGSTYLGFFATGDQPKLVVSSARSLISIDPFVTAHVRSLLGAHTAVQVTATLTTGLTSPNPRVRQDAAIALPRLRGLQHADSASRKRLLDALEGALRNGDRHTPSLIGAADRLRMPAAAEPMLDAYLAQSSKSLQPLLLDTIPRLGAHVAVQRLENSFPTDARAQQRAVQLLAVCPGTHATRCLERLSQTGHPVLRSAAAQAVAARTAQTQTPSTGATADDRFRHRSGFRAIRPGSTK